MTIEVKEKHVILGFDEMDCEHMHQYELLDSLRYSLRRDASHDEVADIMVRFLEDLKIHFMTEELLMRLYHYPGYGLHVIEHDHLVKVVGDLRKELRPHNPAIIAEALEELNISLLDHVRQVDRVLADYLTKIGAELD